MQQPNEAAQPGSPPLQPGGQALKRSAINGGRVYRFSGFRAVSAVVAVQHRFAAALGCMCGASLRPALRQSCMMHAELPYAGLAQ